MSGPRDSDPYAENRAYWDERASFHLDTEMYERFVQQLRDGGDALLPLERGELANLSGQRALHLLCHVGTDTMSLLRRGAQSATGVDFSSVAIDKARALAADLQIPAEFVVAEIGALPADFEHAFDLVFTSAGAIIWMRDLDLWAADIARCLRPGARFYVVDSHPLAYAFAEDSLTGDDPALRLKYPYLEQAEPLRFDATGSYAGPGVQTEQNVTLEWCHSLGDIVNALLAQGLQLEFLREHDRSFCALIEGMVHGDDGHWRLPEPLHGRYPLTFSLSMRTKAR